MNGKMTNEVYHYRSSQDNSLIDDKIPRIAQYTVQSALCFLVLLNSPFPL